MIFIVKRGRSKINQINMRTQQHPSKLRTARVKCGTARYVPVVRKCLIVVIQEQDVLGFQVGMDQVEVVEEGDGA